MVNIIPSCLKKKLENITTDVELQEGPGASL